MRGAAPAPTADPTLDVWREVLTELRAIRQLLETRARPRDADDRGVLLALAASVGDRRFSAVEVIRHATVAPDLRAALEQADVDNSPRSLGRLFRRLEGRANDGITIARVGEDRRGLVWVVRVCVTTPGAGR